MYFLTVGPEWAAVNMAITLCHHCAGSFFVIFMFFVYFFLFALC